MTGKPNHSFKLSGDQYGHFYTLVNPDWKTIISNDRYGNFKVYDFWTGEEVSRFPGDSLGLAFSPDGKVLFSVTPHKYSNFGENSRRVEISIIEYSTGKLLRTLLFENLHIQSHAAHRLRISPDGSILAVQSPISLYRIWTQVWDWQKGQTISIFNPESSSFLDYSKSVCGYWLDAVAIRPNNQIIAAVAQIDQLNQLTTVAIWDIKTMEALYTLGFSLRDHLGMPCSAMTPNGSLLAVGNINKIEVWDLESRQQLCVLCGHQSIISHLTISLDGKTIISYAFNDSIKVWQSSGSLY